MLSILLLHSFRNDVTQIGMAFCFVWCVFPKTKLPYQCSSFAIIKLVLVTRTTDVNESIFEQFGYVQFSFYQFSYSAMQLIPRHIIFPGMQRYSYEQLGRLTWNKKGNTSNGYWTNCVTFTFHLVHQHDLAFPRSNLKKSTWWARLTSN